MYRLCKTKPTISTSLKPNLPNQTYQTKPNTPNLPNKTYQTKPTKPNLPNQITKPNLPNKTYRTEQTNMDLYLLSSICDH